MPVRPSAPFGPFERISIFIDGSNFRYATYNAFSMRVDYTRLLRFLTHNATLVRAYYYTGEWDDAAIGHYIRLTNPADPAVSRGDLERQRDADRRFWRFLNRTGFKVVRKPVRVFRDAQGDVRVKADLDLELAIDMLTLAERCEKQILISGDGDFVPLVDAVAARGVRVVVVSTQSEEAFRNAHYRASDDLLDAADEFVSLESIREHIERLDRPAPYAPREPGGEGGEGRPAPFRPRPFQPERPTFADRPGQPPQEDTDSWRSPGSSLPPEPSSVEG